MSSYRLNSCFTPDRLVLNIVAVQGLWAHPKYTWIKNGVSWLADLLPSDIPNARIYSFGPTFVREDYPLSVCKFPVKFWVVTSTCLILIGLIAPSLRFLAFPSAIFISSLRCLLFLRKYLFNLRTTPATEIEIQALSLLKELVKKGEHTPTILIGHSFGGLVVKQAVIIASTDPHYASLYKSIIGLIFLGTPHKGTMLANASKWWWLPASSDIRSVLEIGSGTLSKLDKDFLNVPFVKDKENIDKIHCFYELEPTSYGPRFLPLFSFITVDKSSATWLGRPSHGLNVQHSSLVKFSNKRDPNYTRIITVLQDIIKRAELLDPKI